jgi:methionine aminotransferase
VQRKPIRVALMMIIPKLGNYRKGMYFKTKMIIINNPHNPTGKILSESDFEALENLLEKYPEIVLLSDEVYEYTFEEKHISAHTRKTIKSFCDGFLSENHSMLRMESGLL